MSWRRFSRVRTGSSGVHHEARKHGAAVPLDARVGAFSPPATRWWRGRSSSACSDAFDLGVRNPPAERRYVMHPGV
jgi:hypothetical protein